MSGDVHMGYGMDMNRHLPCALCGVDLVPCIEMNRDETMLMFVNRGTVQKAPESGGIEINE